MRSPHRFGAQDKMGRSSVHEHSIRTPKVTNSCESEWLLTSGAKPQYERHYMDPAVILGPRHYLNLTYKLLHFVRLNLATISLESSKQAYECTNCWPAYKQKFNRLSLPDNKNDLTIARGRVCWFQKAVARPLTALDRLRTNEPRNKFRFSAL